MIEVAQGSPGSGKSAVAVARAIMHLRRGGVVAANFALVDGWAESIVKNSLLYRLLCFFSFVLPCAAERHLYVRSASLYQRFFRVDSLPAIKKIQPRALAVGSLAGTGSYTEGVGLLVLDEGQLIFNSRKWADNFPWIEFFTQHRKLGWNVILIAHSIDMVDSQVRVLAEYETRFRNLQKVRLPVLGIPLSPFPLFLVIRRYAGLGAGSSVICGRNLYPLPLWAARLYDSLLVFSSSSWTDDTEPLLCGSPPELLCGSGGEPRVRCSSLVGPHWDDYLITTGPSSLRASDNCP